MTITVKRIPNGEFSRKLVEQSKPGDLLNASGVSGLFCLPEQLESVGQYVFIAAGSGITPCYAQLKTVLFASDAKLLLIYSNRTESDTIFYRELQDLQKQFEDRFRIHFLFSERFDVYRSRLSKWLLPQLLQQYLLVPKEEVRFYVCGPWEYMRMVQLTLLGEGFSQAAIKKEQFSQLPRLFQPKPPDLQAHLVTLQIGDKLHALEVQFPQTILAAAKKKGIGIPFSCEAGRCGSCVATCIEGTAWMAYNEVLTDEEVAAGRILCCQAYPVGGDLDILLD